MTRRTIKPAAVKTESFSVEDAIAAFKAMKKTSGTKKRVAKKASKPK